MTPDQRKEIENIGTILLDLPQGEGVKVDSGCIKILIYQYLYPTELYSSIPAENWACEEAGPEWGCPEDNPVRAFGKTPVEAYKNLLSGYKRRATKRLQCAKEELQDAQTHFDTVRPIIEAEMARLPQ